MCNPSKFEQALMQDISRNKVNIYERAIGMLTLVSAYQEHSDEIIRAFTLLNLLPRHALRWASFRSASKPDHDRLSPVLLIEPD